MEILLPADSWNLNSTLSTTTTPSTALTTTQTASAIPPQLNSGGTSTDRFPLPPGAKPRAVMQPWSATSQKGDLNRDHKLTSADAAIALEIAVGSRPCNPTMLAAADMSRDGRAASLDALIILQVAGRAR